jgi:hypothetical protein
MTSEACGVKNATAEALNEIIELLDRVHASSSVQQPEDLALMVTPAGCRFVRASIQPSWNRYMGVIP